MKFSWDIIFIVICIVFLILILIRNKLRRIKSKNKAIAIALRERNNAELFSGIVWLLIGFCYISMPVNSHPREGLFEVTLGMLQVLMGISCLIRSFDNAIICKEYIYIKNRYYKWENIISYVWGQLESEEKGEKYLEYYCLEVEVDKPIQKKILKLDKYNVIKMKINVYDKEKVEELLKEK